MRVDVSLNERVLVLIDGKPQKYLGPGRYRMLVAPWRKAEVKRVNTDALVAYLRAEELALVPAEDLRVIALGPYERALVIRRGKPARWLGACVDHSYRWNVARSSRSPWPRFRNGRHSSCSRASPSMKE